jgi:Uma2 family endonuclease/DNA-binding XRE family transcriptional regulator
MSYEEFLAWSDEDTHAEWVNGEVIVFMPPKIIHQKVGWFLTMLISQFVDTFDLGVVLNAPFEMRLIPDELSREPDLAFIAQEHLHRLNEDRLEGPADLVVEVVSKESVTRDRRNKYHEYARTGVREYWVVDPRPNQRRAFFYALTAQQTYRALPPDGEGRMHSTVLPGFWLREAWLWQRPFPNVNELLNTIMANEHEQPTIQRFGEKMRTLRNRRGMTTRELTVALGYPAESNSYISRIETSKVVPKAEFMLRVADLFGVPIETLMRDELDV